MLRKITVVYPEIYKVTRHYGGPEEGGWHYDWFELVHTFQARETQQDNYKLLLPALHRLVDARNRSEGNLPIGNSRSTGAYEGMISDIPGQFVTRERPRYE
jgi:hypothetical protein